LADNPVPAHENRRLMDDGDEAFMRRAIELAKKGERAPGSSPIGCVIVCDGAVIGEGYNKVDRLCDPTAHAEVVALRDAGAKAKQSRFPGATLYSTLQPCGMCAMASIWAGVQNIVYGAERHQVHTMYFEDRHFDTMDFIRDAFRDGMTISGGVLAEACAALYYKPNDDPPREEQANL
jgi:tRNA(adenine34) deaminase